MSSFQALSIPLPEKAQHTLSLLVLFPCSLLCSSPVALSCTWLLVPTTREMFTFGSTLLSWLHKSTVHREPKSNAGEAGDNNDAVRLISYSSYVRDG